MTASDNYNDDFNVLREAVTEAREPVIPAEYVDEDGYHTITHEVGIKESDVTVLVKFNALLDRELREHIVDKLYGSFAVSDYDWPGGDLLLELGIDSEDTIRSLVGDLDMEISDILDNLQTEVPI